MDFDSVGTPEGISNAGFTFCILILLLRDLVLGPIVWKEVEIVVLSDETGSLGKPLVALEGTAGGSVEVYCLGFQMEKFILLL